MRLPSSARLSLEAVGHQVDADLTWRPVLVLPAAARCVATAAPSLTAPRMVILTIAGAGRLARTPAAAQAVVVRRQTLCGYEPAAGSESGPPRRVRRYSSISVRFP